MDESKTTAEIHSFCSACGHKKKPSRTQCKATIELRCKPFKQDWLENSERAKGTFVLLLCMLHTAQLRAPSLALTNTPVVHAQAAKSVADAAVASQMEVYLKLSKQERQQLNRLMSMPPTYIITAYTSPQLQQQNLDVLNWCTPTLPGQATPLCALACAKWPCTSNKC